MRLQPPGDFYNTPPDTQTFFVNSRPLKDCSDHLAHSSAPNPKGLTCTIWPINIKSINSLTCPPLARRSWPNGRRKLPSKKVSPYAKALPHSYSTKGLPPPMACR